MKLKLNLGTLLLLLLLLPIFLKLLLARHTHGAETSGHCEHSLRSPERISPLLHFLSLEKFSRTKVNDPDLEGNDYAVLSSGRLNPPVLFIYCLYFLFFTT